MDVDGWMWSACMMDGWMGLIGHMRIWGLIGPKRPNRDYKASVILELHIVGFRFLSTMFSWISLFEYHGFCNSWVLKKRIPTICNSRITETMVLEKGIPRKHGTKKLNPTICNSRITEAMVLEKGIPRKHGTKKRNSTICFLGFRFFQYHDFCNSRVAYRWISFFEYHIFLEFVFLVPCFL